MHGLKSLIPYLARFRGKMLWGTVAIGLSTFLALTQPFLNGNGTSRLGQGKPEEELFWIAVIILLLAAVQGVADFFGHYLINEVAASADTGTITGTGARGVGVEVGA